MLNRCERNIIFIDDLFIQPLNFYQFVNNLIYLFPSKITKANAFFNSVQFE